MRLIPIFIFILSYCHLLMAQETFSTPLSERTKNKIDSLFSSFSDGNSPGYAIGISKGQKTLYATAYGNANLDYSIPLSTTSAFSIASVSKQFTAACIALLIMDGKLSLEEKASNYIPQLKKYKSEILVKHLVYNTSGINDYMRLPRSNGESWHTFNYFEIEECIETSLAQDTLLFEPGSQWDYCNVNFMLLSKIVEKISGITFREFIDRRIFTPLDMNKSFINDDVTEVIKNRVTPYNLRQKEYVEGYKEYGVSIRTKGKYIQHPRISPHYGGSGVVTTIEDLLKWSKNMLKLSFGGQAFYDIMHDTPEFQHDRKTQAMGLYYGDFRGRKTISWDGGDWGISSQLVRFPDDKVAIIVLSNLGSGAAYKKANKIAEILIEANVID